MNKKFEYMIETSLSRMFSNVNNPENSIGIITAFRYIPDMKEKDLYELNVRKNKALAADIQNAGYGYVYIDGFWIENKGTPEEKHVSEDSIFFIGKNDDSVKTNLKKWINQWNQDAAIFIPSGKDRSAYLMNKSGSLEKIGTISPNKIATAYTRLRGKGNRTFVFESAHYPMNWLSKLKVQIKNLKEDKNNE